MGYGGEIIWTAVAREIRKREPEKKIALVTTPRWRDRIRFRKFSSIHTSEIFFNNPDFASVKEAVSGRNIEYICMDDHKSKYHSTDLEKISFTRGRHAIEILCSNFDITSPDKKGVFYFTENELKKADEKFQQLGPFIIIEPHAKTEFSQNKSWHFDRWQEVVDGLKDDFTIVQVGVAGKAVLEGVINLTGSMTFREVAALISRSLVFLGTEGGLMHAAAAVGKRAVIIFGGYIPVELTGYEDHVKLGSDLSCAPCGYRVPCPHNLQCMDEIQAAAVIASARELLSV